jgi:hypothetical protein
MVLILKQSPGFRLEARLFDFPHGIDITLISALAML